MELTLFNYHVLQGPEHLPYIKKHGGSLATWNGVLQHVTNFTRSDLCFLTIRLAGYMSCPHVACYDILHNGMSYLYHHPHLPIFYPRKGFGTSPLSCQFQKGTDEYTTVPDVLLEGADNGDMARDLDDLRYFTCNFWLLFGVIVHWI